VLKESGYYGVAVNLYRAVDARQFWNAWACCRPFDISGMATPASMTSEHEDTLQHTTSSSSATSHRRTHSNSSLFDDGDDEDGIVDDVIDVAVVLYLNLVALALMNAFLMNGSLLRC
jgi:hypothetical protein